jgi:hypothetical protein
MFYDLPFLSHSRLSWIAASVRSLLEIAPHAHAHVAQKSSAQPPRSAHLLPPALVRHAHPPWLSVRPRMLRYNKCAHTYPLLMWVPLACKKKYRIQKFIIESRYDIINLFKK